MDGVTIEKPQGITLLEDATLAFDGADSTVYPVAEHLIFEYEKLAEVNVAGDIVNEALFQDIDVIADPDDYPVNWDVGDSNVPVEIVFSMSNPVAPTTATVDNDIEIDLGGAIVLKELALNIDAGPKFNVVNITTSGFKLRPVEEVDANETITVRIPRQAIDVTDDEGTENITLTHQTIIANLNGIGASNVW